MSETILVNFHCHSLFSDGEQTPEALVANLAAAGVRYASLTDHDSIEGLPRFTEASKKRGIASLPGVELTTCFRGREAHLLGYGFDPEFADLCATLISLRQVRDLDVHSIAGSLRKIGANRTSGYDSNAGISAAPNGRMEIGNAIDLIHRAGGSAFWAHPLIFESDPLQLESCVAELKSMGLDGLEAIYAPFTKSQRAELEQLALKHDLIVSAGTDFHSVSSPGASVYSIRMPRKHWIKYRENILANPAFEMSASGQEKTSPDTSTSRVRTAVKSHQFRRRSFILRVFLPTLIAIALFLATIWSIILPSFEKTLLDRKREMIRELTNSAWSILASYQRDVHNGLLSREQAQTMAIMRIEALRYGPESKDYFWIQDMEPRMVMHPYRIDLNKQALNGFTDPRGVAIFVEFARLVRQKGEGYIDYVWQWKDDPQRLEPKESFVKGFKPWGWVIGTGIYIDDVNSEIARIEGSLINTSLAISGAVVLLLLFVLQQSLRIERERQEVVDTLRESTDRFHTLVEATTEGTLLIIEDRCRYANPMFLSMTGYSSTRMEFLELTDLLPREEENWAIWERFERMNSEQFSDGEVFDGVLQHADGHFIECVLAMNPIHFAGQQGIILLARDIASQSTALAEEAIFHAAQSVPVGIFRAKAVRRAIMIEMNPAAHMLMAPFADSQPALADLFSENAEFESIMRTLKSGEEVNQHVLHVESSDATKRFLSLSAKLIHDKTNDSQYIDGILVDVSASQKLAAGREALIEKLQASLLFLHEPITRLGRDVVVCSMDTNIKQLSRLMTDRNVTSALVASENGAIIGIVTDHDLRARVLAENISLEMPIHAIMSAPLTKISENALIYEALMRMEEKDIRHLAVEDADGHIISVIDNKSLLQFQRYGAISLLKEGF